tara:strand:+ start:363 stop:725 length:363 start_codon:yes stop_codon:yes gene_type:complete
VVAEQLHQVIVMVVMVMFQVLEEYLLLEVVEEQEIQLVVLVVLVVEHIPQAEVQLKVQVTHPQQLPLKEMMEEKEIQVLVNQEAAVVVQVLLEATETQVGILIMEAQEELAQLLKLQHPQ